MKILFAGLGNLGSQVLDLFVLRAKRDDQFLVGGRNQEYIGERVRWSVAAALQLGVPVQAATTYMDIWNVEQTAQTIAAFKPDVIFSSMTVLPSTAIERLPAPLSHKLSQAQGGPWLPTTLALVHRLMRAVKETGLKIAVLNGGTPDNSHEVLSKIGLAPTSGIGNIALPIPPLRQAIAQQFLCSPEQVEVLLFAHAYVVQCLRRGTTGEAPFHLTALVDGKDVTSQLDLPALFSTLPATLEHEYTQLLTAASAATVFDVLTVGAPAVAHAPGPNGLPGGYPVRAGRHGLEIVLPQGLTLDEAIYINQGGQRFYGIERVEDDGTVHFAEWNMAIFKEIMGYECRQMPLSEVDGRANELKERYLKLLAREA